MKKNIWKLLAAIISLVVMLTVVSAPVFADEPAATGDVTEAETSPDETSAGTAAPADTGEETSAETGSGSSGSDNSTTASKKVNRYGLVTLIITAVILVIILIWVLRDRERAVKTWRSFKSEFKKVVWADRHETLKNTILVVVAILVFAAVFGVIDYLLSLLIVTLGRII